MSKAPISLLTERALSPPRRDAPLVGLALELRRPGIWIEICRHAAKDDPEWLANRLNPDDRLIAAIGACGEPEHDTRAARAVCAVALGLCGRLAEPEALAPAANLFAEPAPGDLGKLDPSTQPSLVDLVAALRDDPTGRSRRVSTVVCDAQGRAQLGSVTVSLCPGRSPGLRLDFPMRLFSARDESLEEAIDAVGRRLGHPRSPLRVRVESSDGAGGGDACAAAIAAAAEATLRRRHLDEEVVVIGAVGDGGTLRPSRSPLWDQVTATVERSRSGSTVLAAGANGVKDVHALRRALGAPTRKRRALIGAGIAVGLAALAAAILVPSPGADPEADQAAQQARELLPSSPLRAALSAARAISLREDGRSRRAAADVFAASPLTEATGQEDGHLVAVAMSDGHQVTTVSTVGRATRWLLHEDRLEPISAASFPAGSAFLALSQDGRWLLVRPPESYEQALLIDTSGRHSSRLLEAPEGATFAVGDGERPVVATGDSEGLHFDGGDSAPSVGEVEALALSPSGRILAVASAGSTALFERRQGAWAISREWRRELPPVASAEIERIEVDNRGNTLLALTHLGSSLRWSSRRTVGEYRTSDGPGALAGRSLFFLPMGHRLLLSREAPGGTVVATSFPAPPDDATERRVAVSAGGDRAVVAAPDGLFSVLDLRRVRIAPGNVVTDSVAIHAHRLSVLEDTPGGSRTVSWDLRSLAPPRLGPSVPGAARIATVAADGTLVAATTEHANIVIRSTATGRRLGSVRGRGDESWSNLAADRDGDLLAAVDENRDAVTVWKREPGDKSRWSGRVTYRGPAVDRPEPEFPDPLAMSPDGTLLIRGTADRLWLRNLESGAESRLPTDGIGDVIRVRFGISDDQAILSTSNGVTELSGAQLAESRELSGTEAHDARAFGAGHVAAANPFGVQLLTGNEPIDAYQGWNESGTGAGTISVSADGTIAIPHFESLPLVLLRDPRPTRESLCGLAGGRPAASDGCGDRPPLPEPRPAAGTQEDRGADVTLSASGLGAIGLGRSLPPQVERLHAYEWGSCAARTLPGRSVLVISNRGEAESISLFSAAYVPEDAGYPEDIEAATDRGMTPSAAFSARDFYGPPDERKGWQLRWWLPRADGRRSLLTVDTNYAANLAVTMSVGHPRCEGWE